MRSGIHRWSPLFLVLAAASTAAAAEQPQERKAPAAKFDTETERHLREMSDFLAEQRQFTVQTQGTLEVVDNKDEKIQIHRQGKVLLQRPDRLKVERSGDLADLELYYDGRQLSLYGKKNHAYATTPAPPSLDATLNMAQDQLGLDPPAADLLYSSVYNVLRDNMNSGRYLGRANVEGVTTHHLAFRGDEVDVQLWIEDGPRPLPRKYVVTSKEDPQAPQYSVVLSDWDLTPRLSDAQFTFQPPSDAMKVSFLAPDTRGDSGSKEQPGKRNPPNE
ncbi:DUF2092 domain-containing protein [Pyxidicoccus sp. 3LG]